MKTMSRFLALALLLAALLSACGGGEDSGTVSYELTTALEGGQMTFVGVGGDIEGQTNPTLHAKAGDTVEITLSSGEGAVHDIAFPDFDATSEQASGAGESVELSFVVDKSGSFDYYCVIPGHQQLGMAGTLEVSGEAASGEGAASAAEAGGDAASVDAEVKASAPAQAPATDGADVVRDPTDLPGPIPTRAGETVRIDLEAVEVEGQLAEGTTYTYWTFNGKVPGPFFRVRVGDTLEVHMLNNTSSTMVHSVDFHAVTGPGGGAAMTQTPPGEETVFTGKALAPGLYVYHCATPVVADHIANGMYGLILVEPEGGLSPVDREFYVMQGELYTAGAFGEQGHQTADAAKLLNEEAEYFILNGAVGALTDQKPLRANVGETVRIFFGVGGPNYTSSFHVIGEIFDRVYDLASLTADPLTDVQTTLVPPGGATMVEFELQVPGNFLLVDHALSRLQRGLAGYLIVEGDENPEIINGEPSEDSGH